MLSNGTLLKPETRKKVAFLELYAISGAHSGVLELRQKDESPQPHQARKSITQEQEELGASWRGDARRPTCFGINRYVTRRQVVLASGNV